MAMLAIRIALWLTPWIVVSLACAANSAQESALQSSSVRLVYVKDHTFYFADGHANVTHQVDVSVPIGAFSVSPDSSQIVFESGTGDFGGSLRLLTVATGRIELLRRESNTPKRVSGRTDFGYSYDVPEFSPSGKSIAYVANHGYSAGDVIRGDEPFEIMELGTRHTRSIKTDLMLHEGHQTIGRLSWSPNEKYLSFGLHLATYVDLGTQHVQWLAENKQLSDTGAGFGWYGANCLIVDAHMRQLSDLHQPADLLLYGMNLKTVTSLLGTIKVPAGDLPAFTQMEMAGSLMLLAENNQRVFLYNIETHEPVATIDATRARLVPVQRASASCE